MLDIARIPVARQRVVGEELGELLHPSPKGSKKKGEALPADVVALGGEVVTRTHAFEGVATLPKLTIDNTADRVYGGFFKLVVGEAQCLDATLVALSPALEARRRAADLVRVTAFKKGVGFLKFEMSLQYQQMRDVVRHLRGATLTDAVRTLGLEPHVAHLEAHLAPYGVAVKTTSGDDLERLSDAWHEAFTRFAAAVIAQWPSGHETREALLKPYQRELDALRAQQAAARKASRARRASAPTK